MSMASSAVIDSFKFARRPSRNASNSLAGFEVGSAMRPLMRTVWAAAMSATSLAQVLPVAALADLGHDAGLHGIAVGVDVE